MIAEALPMSDRVATKSDIDALQIATRADLHAMEARIFRWMIGFFATLWVSSAAMIVAIVMKGP